MPIYKDGNNFKVIKDGRDFDLPQAEVATKAEMEAYILNMAPANIEASGNDLIITFMPFPTKYVNYIKQKQYRGKRTQVFWQLVRYVGRTIYRKTNVFSTQGPSSESWRQNDNSDLYHWSFPTRRLVGINGESAEGSMEPYSFNLTPQQATLGRIVWYGGYPTILRFIKRPYLARYNVTPRKIAIIIGMARHGMRDQEPWTYKKSNDFEYNDQGPITPMPLEGIPLAISNVEVLIEPYEDDYWISFSNVSQDLLNYAEENKINPNTAIFLQTFNYTGGQNHGVNRRGVRKNITSPVKNQLHRRNIGIYELENGLLLSEITNIVNGQETPPGYGWKSLRARYNKGDPETFHNISVALVLANTGMNDGFRIYKESNKVNII